MNGKLWGITVALAIALAAIVYVVGSKPKTQQQAIISPIASPMVQQSVTPSGNAAQSVSRYISYSKDTYDQMAAKKRVFYFHATWCPICNVVNEELAEKEDQIPSDIVVFKADYDSETELKKKYAVTYQHTFVQVDAEGKKVTAWNGGGIDELVKRIQ